MKKLIALFSLFSSLFGYTLYAADTTFMWPVKGELTESNILYRPNDFIGDEQVYGDLVIGTNAWDTIISPVDGIITDFFFTYKYSMSNGVSYGAEHFFNKSKDSIVIKNARADLRNSKYFTATISLLCADGRKVFLTGFIPAKWFKTGEKLKKGDLLGKASYSYHKIPNPSLFLSVSISTVPDDPMAPFGLKSTFVRSKKFAAKESMSKSEMQEDLAILKASLVEGLPGLYDYISQTELQKAFDNLREKINTIKSRQEFEKQLSSLLRLIHDSHLSIEYDTPSFPEGSTVWPAISFGFLNDSLVVTRTFAAYKDYLGRRISKVNGYDVDTIKKAVFKTIGEHDGFVESYPDFVLLTLTSLRYFNELQPSIESRDLDILFHDGVRKQFKGKDVGKNSCPKYYPSWRAFYVYPNERFFTQMVSDSIAHLGISTFDLNDLEMTRIKDFIQSLNSTHCKSLIIDLRNNFGGNTENLSILYDLISKDAFKLSEFSLVNTNGTYSFFKFTENYSPLGA